MSSPQNDSNSLPPGVPPEAAAFLQEIGYFQPDRLQTGDASPRLHLKSLNTDETVEIGSPNAALPTVLIFGSYT